MASGAAQAEVTSTASAAPPLRVLHVYSGNFYGGLEVFLLSLARLGEVCPALQTEFALCFEGRLSRSLREAGVPVTMLGGVRFSRPWEILRARRTLARRLDTNPPDIVVVHDCWPHTLASPIVRRHGLPVVMWMHTTPQGAGWLERLAARTPPDHLICDSRFIESVSTRVFPDIRPPRSVLYYPIAPPAMTPAERVNARARLRCELGASDSTTVIALPARLTPYKGHALLVDALSRVDRGLDWAAWIIGQAQQPAEVEHETRLHAEIERLGLSDRVRFLGFRDDVPALLAAADIHCQPNTGPEPFGIAFVEALDAGLPVVTTRLGGGAEVVDESCGLLVPPADPDALGDALASLITSPERRHALGAAGPARARALCDPETVLPALHALLSRVKATANGTHAHATE